MTANGRFAFGGGCNYLIKNNKAILLTDAVQLTETLGWSEVNKKPKKQQIDLFVQLSEEEKKIIEILSASEVSSIDEINFKSALTASAVANALLNLELQGLVISLPGKIYRLT